MLSYLAKAVQILFNENVMKQRIKLLSRIFRILNTQKLVCFSLSWILNSRKHGKAEEEHLTLSNFACLFLPFSVLPLKHSHMDACIWQWLYSDLLRPVHQLRFVRP